MTTMAFDEDAFFLFTSPKVEEYPSSLDALLDPSVTWKDYIEVFVNGGYATKISIHNVTDGKVWASSPNFNVHPVEVKDVVYGFDDSATLRLQGIAIAGRAYTLTRVTGQRVMVGRDARSASGCVIYRANTCVLVAVYEEGTHPGGCFSTVVKVGDYLQERGF